MHTQVLDISGWTESTTQDPPMRMINLKNFFLTMCRNKIGSAKGTAMLEQSLSHESLSAISRQRIILLVKEKQICLPRKRQQVPCQAQDDVFHDITTNHGFTLQTT